MSTHQNLESFQQVSITFLSIGLPVNRVRLFGQTVGHSYDNKE